MSNNGTTAQHDLDKTMASLRAAAKDIVELGNHRIVAAKDKVIGRGTAMIERVRHLIATHPFAAVGLAFGVGYVIMRMRRR